MTNEKKLLSALKYLVDQSQEDMPYECRTKHFDLAIDDAFAVINEVENQPGSLLRIMKEALLSIAEYVRGIALMEGK